MVSGVRELTAGEAVSPIKHVTTLQLPCIMYLQCYVSVFQFCFCDFQNWEFEHDFTDSYDSICFQIAETCQLAIERIQWLKSEQSKLERLSDNPYCSVDPAPPSEETDIKTLRSELMNEELSLYKRYRAMFALRNIGSEDCVLALADGK